MRQRENRKCVIWTGLTSGASRRGIFGGEAWKVNIWEGREWMDN